MALVPISILKPHEHIIFDNLKRVLESIVEEGQIHTPIIVDSNTLTILDGHHRVASLKLLAATRAPVLLVDYFSDVVELDTWRPGVKVTKHQVVRAAERGVLYPPKTTRHKLRIQVPKVSVRLSDLV